jgi:hypothetical protein
MQEVPAAAPTGEFPQSQVAACLKKFIAAAVPLGGQLGNFPSWHHPVIGAARAVADCIQLGKFPSWHRPVSEAAITVADCIQLGKFPS